MTINYEVAPQDGDCFQFAGFRLWLDEASKDKIKGIIVLTPGSGADGRADTRDKDWREFAKANHCALLGVCLTDVNFKADEDYIDAKNGSGQALLEALDAFETQVFGAPKKLPLLMWGHSAGGEFNYEFACWAPERVAAFVVNKGGFYYTGLAPIATRWIPAAFFVGEYDATYRKVAVYGIFHMGKAAGAPRWQLFEEPKAGHEVGESLDVSLELFRKVLSKLGGN